MMNESAARPAVLILAAHGPFWRRPVSDALVAASTGALREPFARGW